MTTTTTPRPCTDCVNLHGEPAAAWLNSWPLGADWRPRFKAYLCDGCADERAEWETIEPDPYDMPPYSHD